ncbi:hypothetical protein LOTGIDRAFT_114342 [Lottia gigantea]|uniref:Cytochrome b5 heme-binding domain-containing protein n=1 Tax=Lottia gigantea TaxID=225164 RepID=V4C970_LOTGI|nr:hypothetical protein LOTGIDRAFT_114342 [Lottia gigantea]ESO98309.1 hypothetical protein LOTGIDRAFT_114342 [Lottia gigantea]
MEELPSKQRQFTLDLVSEHSNETSCWIVVNDMVYDVTSFLDKHPGGSDVVLEHAGTDATVAFEDKGHSKYGVKLLEKYIIGELIEVS